MWRFSLSFLRSTLGILPILATGWAWADLIVLPEQRPNRVFSGENRPMTLRLCNSGEQPVAMNVRAVVSQASTTLVAPLYERNWRGLTVLAGQAVSELVRLDFPAVRAESRFLISWIGDSNHVIGTTEVLVYPTNLPAEFKTLAGEEPLGILDPTDELKPLLRSLAVEFQDFATHGTGGFQGRLAIFGPFAAADQMREGLAAEIRALARRGVAVVWLQPPREPRAPLKPSFYTVREGDGAIVVAQHEMAAHLAENPEAQLNLLRLAERALRPEPLDLPETGNSN